MEFQINMREKVTLTIIGVGIMALLLSIGIAAPKDAVAQEVSTIETPFAGPQLFSLTCTCSGTLLIFVYDLYSMMPKALVYQPGVSVIYSNFNIYGQYLLGTYMPGAGYCTMATPIGCPSISNDGMLGFLPGTGTSL